MNERKTRRLDQATRSLRGTSVPPQNELAALLDPLLAEAGISWARFGVFANISSISSFRISPSDEISANMVRKIVNGVSNARLPVDPEQLGEVAERLLDAVSARQDSRRGKRIKPDIPKGPRKINLFEMVGENGISSENIARMINILGIKDPASLTLSEVRRLEQFIEWRTKHGEGDKDPVVPPKPDSETQKPGKSLAEGVVSRVVSGTKNVETNENMSPSFLAYVEGLIPSDAAVINRLIGSSRNNPVGFDVRGSSALEWLIKEGMHPPGRRIRKTSDTKFYLE